MKENEISTTVCSLVTKNDFYSALSKLSEEKYLALDCETTGLRIWQQDRLFSIIIGTDKEQFYFNFNQSSEDPLPKILLQELKQVFLNKVIFMANAKFDLACLHREGLEIGNAEVVDVLVLARLLYNAHPDYTLEACAKREGLAKSDVVENFIDDNGLWEHEIIPGRKQKGKKKFFDRVPLPIISEYGKKDVEVTYRLGMLYMSRLEEISKNTLPGKPNISSVVKTEIALTKICFEMEKVGVQIDRVFCERMLRTEKERYTKAAQEFEKLCGKPFVDSNKALFEAFSSMGVSGSKTEKGNPSFTDEALENIKHPLAQYVRDYRNAHKKAGTYYQGFIYFSDEASTVHANMKQAGTTTGRFSYREPNLQNVPDDEIRKAIVTREGFWLVEFDYKQVEYRLMAEYAEEMGLIEKIKSGMDVHIATAELMDVERKPAKTLNFMLLYGGGAQKLADSLEIELQPAKELKVKYFSVLPKVKIFISNVTRLAEMRGFIFNWLGRRAYFPDKKFSYKASNALIQGGCADIVKVAMVKIAEFLTPYKTRMVLQVHDSILFEMPKEEFFLLPKIKNILENSYPAKYLKMEVSCAISAKNWGEMIDLSENDPLLLENASETRDSFQNENQALS